MNNDPEHADDRVEQQRQLYQELLQELRTVIPGVQVLFAFLLTAPFASRFGEIDRLGKIVFAVSLMAAAIATAILLAPAAYHRVGDRRDRHTRLRYGVQAALGGLSLLAISVTGTIFVVVRFMFDNTTLAIVLATAVALLCAALWAIIPLILGRGS